MPTSSQPRAHRFLGAPETRRFLQDYVRKRVGESDVDDVVQTVLVEALGSRSMPDEETEVRKWLTGVARHKIADLHRRRGREQPAELPDIETAPPPIEERELTRWAEKQADSSADAQKTLQWMAREGEGDKLEHIADEEQVPAARVRQRVSRMRRFMKERWLAELAAVAAVALVALLVWRAVRDPAEPEIARDPSLPPTPTADPTEAPPPVAPRVAEGREARKKALEACSKGEHQRCLDGLDRAKELDPAGDAAPDVQGARESAKKALEQTPQEEIKPIESAAPPQLDKKAPAPPLPTGKPTATPPPTAPPKSDFPQKKGPTKPQPDFGKSSALEKKSSEATVEVLAPPKGSMPSQHAPPPTSFGSPQSLDGLGSSSGPSSSVKSSLK